MSEKAASGALYNKHRPTDLAGLLGNKDTRASIEMVMSKKNRPHVFLLVGPPGCGKTTVAYIMARMINGDAEGVERDIIEMNTADLRGIDSARSIIQQMQYAPSKAAHRIWIIEEAHALTKDAQDALLKALEFTPEHVYFILTTTEPEKLRAALRSRCTTFQMSALSPLRMAKLLNRVCEAEGAKVREDVIDRISQDCGGSARTALVTLEKVLGLPAEQQMKVAKQVMEMENKCIDLCRILIKKVTWKQVSEVLRGLEEDPESIRRGVFNYAAAVLLNSGEPRAYLVMDSFDKPFYDTGTARGMLYKACYAVINV